MLFRSSTDMLSISLLKDINKIDCIVRSNSREEIVKNLNELALEILIETIEYIKTPDSTVFDKDFIREFLTNCDKNTYGKIRDKGIELRQSAELKPLDIECTHCNHKHQQPFNINIADFFD